mmetsp:Transcript_33348/g.77996  ORF Transcript_33348/g.77996 Transcript_33348/m.77996 type:complete len:313 (+) Transcript_33348:619-1557(+)
MPPSTASSVGTCTAGALSGGGLALRELGAKAGGADLFDACAGSFGIGAEGGAASAGRELAAGSLEPAFGDWAGGGSGGADARAGRGKKGAEACRATGGGGGGGADGAAKAEAFRSMGTASSPWSNSNCDVPEVQVHCGVGSAALFVQTRVGSAAPYVTHEPAISSLPSKADAREGLECRLTPQSSACWILWQDAAIAASDPSKSPIMYLTKKVRSATSSSPLSTIFAPHRSRTRPPAWGSRRPTLGLSSTTTSSASESPMQLHALLASASASAQHDDAAVLRVNKRSRKRNSARRLSSRPSSKPPPVDALAE